MVEIEVRVYSDLVLNIIDQNETRWCDDLSLYINYGSDTVTPFRSAFYSYLYFVLVNENNLFFFVHLVEPILCSNAEWSENAITVAIIQSGNQSNPSRGPHGIFIDKDQTLYIAEFDNHRIVAWKKCAFSPLVKPYGFSA